MAVDIAQARGDGAGVLRGAEANLAGRRATRALIDTTVLGVIGAERVAQAELETAERRGLVHDHVVVADRVGGAEGSAHVGLAVAGAERIDRAEVLRGDVGLAAKFQQAPRIALQADGGLTAEQAAALARLAVGRVEAAFQREHGAQAVAQVFGAAQAPARTAGHAVGHADLRFLVAVIALDALEAHAGVDQAVQGHRGFSMRHAGQRGEQSGDEQSLFHYRFPLIEQTCACGSARNTSGDSAHDRNDF